MASDVVFTAVQDFLSANFTTCPIVYENDIGALPDPPSAWVYTEIYGVFYDQQSFGSGVPASDHWREEGAVLMHVMTPVGTGSLRGRQIATELATLFKGLKLAPDDIRFADLSIGGGMTAQDDGNFYPLTVRAEWARG